jgi:hypothetical protein
MCNIIFFLLPYFCYSDEWDIFNTPVSEEKNNTETLNWSYLKNYSFGLVYNHSSVSSDSVLAPDETLYTIEKNVYSFQLTLLQKVLYKNMAVFIIDAGVETSNKNTASILPLLEQSPVNSMGYSVGDMSFTAIKINQLFFQHLLFDQINLQLGVLGLQFGNNWVINPVNYFSKYARNTTMHQKYYQSLLSFQADWFYANYSLKALYAPGIKMPPPQAMNIVNVSDFIVPNHIMLIKNNLFFNNHNFDFYVYGEADFEKPENTYYGGFALGWSRPLNTFINTFLEYSFYNGISDYTLQSYHDGLYNAVYFTRVDDSALTPKSRILAGVNASLGDWGELSLSYYFNQFGARSHVFNKAAEKLKQIYNEQTWSNAAESQYIYSFLAEYDPLSLRRHYLFISWTKSNIFRYFQLVVSPLLSLEDGSGYLNNKLTMQFDETWDISVLADISLGANNSLFGMNPTKIKTGVEFNLRF